jgi:putative ABC transport system permease protein
VLQDLRYGLRMLRKNLGFTIIAVLSLGIGIGATTTVFSVVNAFLFRPLPVKDPDRLVSIHKPGGGGIGIHTISYPDYLDYLERNEHFSEILAWSEAALSLNTGDQPEAAYGMVVSGNYFNTLGVQPALGRVFGPDEDRVRGGHPVTVISFGLWQSHFGSDPAAIGQIIKLNGHPFTVIGVAPKGFTSTYSVFSPAVYVPLSMQAQVRSNPKIFDERMSKYLKLTARLAPGVSRQQAEAALSALDRQLESEHPQKGRTSLQPNRGIELASVGSFPPEERLMILGAAALFIAIVGFVLLIASANVAGMLLARATTRQREIAVRLAMGATRARLIRQLLTESGLLFLISAIAGIGLTIWLTRLISAISLPTAVPVALDANIDWRVLSFTLLLALTIGFVFGLGPAVSASKSDLLSAMKDAPALLGVKRSRLRNVFVVGQIALTLVLMIGAGLFARALQFAENLYPGRDPESVLIAGLDPSKQAYNTAKTREFYDQLTQRLTAQPGVESVSLARTLPIGGSGGNTSIEVKDAPHEGVLKAEANRIAPRYFETLGMRMLSGRDFSTADRQNTLPVLIINEAMARRFWPGESALGKEVKAGGGKWAQVVGIVEDGTSEMSGEAPAPYVYSPYFQGESYNSTMTVLLRYRGDTAEAVVAVRREVQTLDPNLPLEYAMSLSEAVRLSVLPWRVVGIVARVFGLIGLALASMGIYGLVSYVANQRTHEIGVRVALGAQKRDILRLVVGHGLKLGVFGVTIGLALSLALTRLVASFLFGISASDPLTYISVTLLLVLVAVGASFGPARKAIGTDPMIALRHE